jgi:hypothetical protein
MLTLSRATNSKKLTGRTSQIPNDVQLQPTTPHSFTAGSPDADSQAEFHLKTVTMFEGEKVTDF